jgi:hypothetical protein
MKRTNDHCAVPFHSYVTGALVSGNSSFLLRPITSLSPRLANEADNWAHFKVRALSFRLHPHAQTGSTGMAAGVVGGVQDTPPATVASVLELLPSTVLAPSETVPTNWVNVTRGDLAGPFPWYKTVAGTADVTEEAPGYVVVAGNSTDTFSLEFRGVFEFKTAVGTGNTPQAFGMRAALRLQREAAAQSVARMQLLRLLASTSSGEATGALLGPPNAPPAVSQSARVEQSSCPPRLF